MYLIKANKREEMMEIRVENQWTIKKPWGKSMKSKSVHWEDKKYNRPSVWLVKEKCSNYQNQESGSINVDLTEIKGLYYEQLYVKKLENLDETWKFLEDTDYWNDSRKNM